MKKLLILSALFIFACSSDDASNEENTNPSNEKLIESVTFHSVQTCLDYSDFRSANTTNCTYNSDNLITSFKTQFYDLECPNDLLYEEQNSTNYIEHLDGYLIASSMGVSGQIDLNDNGYIDTIDWIDEDGNIEVTSNIVYDNGYISSITRDDGSSGVNYIYQNGNLIRTEGIGDDRFETVTSYTTFENKSKLFHPFFRSFMPHYPLQNYYGKNSTNLPSTRVFNRYYEGELSYTETEYYTYSFDNEGYVTFLEIGTFFKESEYSNIDNTLTEVTLEITYTN